MGKEEFIDSQILGNYKYSYNTIIWGLSNVSKQCQWMNNVKTAAVRSQFTNLDPLCVNLSVLKMPRRLYQKTIDYLSYIV